MEHSKGVNYLVGMRRGRQILAVLVQEFGKI